MCLQVAPATVAPLGPHQGVLQVDTCLTGDRPLPLQAWTPHTTPITHTTDSPTVWKGVGPHLPLIPLTTGSPICEGPTLTCRPGALSSSGKFIRTVF